MRGCFPTRAIASGCASTTMGWLRVDSRRCAAHRAGASPDDRLVALSFGQPGPHVRSAAGSTIGSDPSAQARALNPRALVGSPVKGHRARSRSRHPRRSIVTRALLLELFWVGGRTARGSTVRAECRMRRDCAIEASRLAGPCGVGWILWPTRDFLLCLAMFVESVSRLFLHIA